MKHTETKTIKQYRGYTVEITKVTWENNDYFYEYVVRRLDESLLFDTNEDCFDTEGQAFADARERIDEHENQ